MSIYIHTKGQGVLGLNENPNFIVFHINPQNPLTLCEYIYTHKGSGGFDGFFIQILINFCFALNPQNPLTLCEYIYTHKGSGGFDGFSGVRG